MKLIARFSPLAAFTVSCCALAPAASAQYNAVTDFSITANQNVNGVWSYGQTPTRGGTFSLLQTAETNFSFSNSIEAWRGTATGFSGNYPFIAHNKTATTQTYLTVTQPIDLLNLHPGPSGENAVVRFTAPQAGTFRIQGRFQGLDNGPTTTDVALLLNGIVQYTSGINTNNNGNLATFDLTRTFAIGDRLDFSVGYGNGFYGNDSTGLAVSIGPAAAPEPGTLGLLCVGALTLAGGIARRRAIR